MRVTRISHPVRMDEKSNGGRVLQMKDACERCSSVLDATASAVICSYECTFCTTCRDELGGVCPNCGGELVPRPRRAAA